MTNPSAPITTDIVLIDVVDYSLLSNEDQLSTVGIIQEDLAQQIHFVTEIMNLRKSEVVLGYTPTGDGMYIVVNPAVCGYGVVLGLSIRNYLVWLSTEQSNALYQGVRVAVHTGKALPFTDVNGITNYVGDGMNDCARLLTVSDEDAIKFCGDTNYVIASQEACHCLHKMFASDDAKKYLSTMNLKMSALKTILDKHMKPHQACLVEGLPLAFAPPPNFIRTRRRAFSRTSKGNTIQCEPSV